MTIETDICTALNDLVDGRVYPDVAPAGAATPYVTYQQVGGAPVIKIMLARMAEKISEALRGMA